MIGTSLENQDLIRVAQDQANRVRNLSRREKMMLDQIEDATPAPVLVQILTMIKARKIKVISKLEKRKMEYKLKGLIERLIKMTVELIVIQVEKENLIKKEEVNHLIRIEGDQKIETGLEIDRGTDRVHGIDRETGTEGEQTISKKIHLNSSLYYAVLINY